MPLKLTPGLSDAGYTAALNRWADYIETQITKTNNQVAFVNESVLTLPAPTVTVETTPWFFWPETSEVAGSALTPASNVIYFVAFYLPAQITINSLAVAFSGFSPSDTVDWGIYSSTGALLCHVGPQVVNNSGGNNIFDIAVTNVTTLSSGNYFFAVTDLGGHATFITVAVNNWKPYANQTTAFQSSTTSSAGTLPSTIAIGSFAPDPADQVFSLPKWYAH